jgi:uncharacterized RDD family membrane protein YckC
MNNTQKRRIGAFIIDAIVIGFFATFAENIFSLFDEKFSFDALGLTFYYKFSFSILFYVFYFVLFDLINNGVTLGKMIFKIKVVFLDETELPKVTRLKRSLLKVVGIVILPIAVLLFFLNNFFTIHDHFCQTITISKSRIN